MTLRLADDNAVLQVARRHGTQVAAVWSGRSSRSVVRLRQQVDGYDRGRGRTTKAEIDAAEPSVRCRCPRCQDWRDSEAETARLRAQRERAARAAARRQSLAASMDFLVGTPDEWRLEAVCLGEHPDLFFPERGQSTKEAKALCARCPVSTECLEYALTSQNPSQDLGVFGGTSARERRRMRKTHATPDSEAS